MIDPIAFEPRRLADEPAYPCEGPNAPAYGLTKREFFAAMAMQGLRADRQQFPRDEIARMAVADADALLKELAK